MKKKMHMARRKMSHVIDELYTALFQLGGEEVDLRLRKEEQGLRLTVRGDFSPENRRQPYGTRHWWKPIGNWPAETTIPVTANCPL